jgi:hypothetical protein
MRLTVTVLPCSHVVFSRQDNGRVLGTILKADLTLVDQEGDPPLLNRIREFIRRYKLANPAATNAQIKTALELEDF